MELSVVVPTLNGRDQLAACLDALAAHAPDAEVIVVNGPSADGTTGMVRERDDVDVLVEIADRSVTVARNAGIEVTTGDAIALVDFDLRIEEGWSAAVREGLDEAPVVTGPTHRTVEGGVTTDDPEERDIADRHVVYFNGGNVAFDRETLYGDLDGFDEYLVIGGARDAAHRLAGMGVDVHWASEMCVCGEYDESSERDWGWKYRALNYRLVKNYGLRPTVVRRTVSHAVADAYSAARDVLAGEGRPSAWFGNGRDVVVGTATGASDGLVARATDRSPRRNPNGLSTRDDRAVARYDWRSG